MAAKKKVTVLIADDQTLFREGIKDLLENEKSIEVIGEAADGSEVLRLAKKLKPYYWLVIKSLCPLIYLRDPFFLLKEILVRAICCIL